ncbi:hypothetical protein Tco_0953773 [Tanacetum coccineum]|uniref:Uncharacterized protein n=1 Tax=Tanacetum coccineum TaxID=301880 RepID=A0ABQ5E395_9ASTR
MAVFAILASVSITCCQCISNTLVAFDLLRDALSAIFGLSELKAWDAKDALGYILDCTLKDLALSPSYIANFNLEEDEEDPEEDPADYPANEGDQFDDEFI